jgi:hypothetical protein
MHMRLAYLYNAHGGELRDFSYAGPSGRLVFSHATCVIESTLLPGDFVTLSPGNRTFKCIDADARHLLLQESFDEPL